MRLVPGLAPALLVPALLALTLPAPTQELTRLPAQPAAQPLAHAPWLDTSLSPEQRAHALVAQMTLEEKAAQSVNTAPAIPRLGVPAYDYWSEGLHGIARSGYATLFPQAIGMAATWDAPLLQQIGEVVSVEARAKFNQALRDDIHSIFFGLTIWSPNINIFRDPRWGRGQETYGEDPFLTGTLGVNFIRGLQGPDPLHPRAIATPKHFAVHSGPESERHRFDVDPSPHDLWDTYLPQFRMAIVDAHADSIMCAYNAVYGKPACASPLLLEDVLRKDWGFSGFVTSDCGAVDDFFEQKAHHTSPDKEHAAALGILTGTDTNCGHTYLALPAAVHAGLLTQADLDRTLERLFVARIRLGLFDPPAANPYAAIPFSQDRAPAHLALSLQASREAMVLLKNDGILPLAAGRYRRVAVVGPNAASLAALEGNYNAIPKDPQMPIDALREAMPSAQVVYAQGSPYVEGLALPVPRTLLHPAPGDPAEGLQAEYFPTADFTGQPVARRLDHQIDFEWSAAAPVPGVPQDAFAVRWSGVIVPPRPGDLHFNVRLVHCSSCREHEHYAVRIDGKQVATNAQSPDDSHAAAGPGFTVHFDDVRPHPIVIEYTHHAPLFGAGIAFEWFPPAGVLQDDAATLASNSDLVVAMLGLSPNLEGEEMKIDVPGFSGGDRTDIDLPAPQRKLLEALLATGKPVVVVLLNGSALAVDLAQQRAPAILEAWYPGEFGGKAIAQTLLGENDPAGRLPVTFYRSTADLPAFTDYSMQNRTYRYFSGHPLYGFGFGLSYTRFAYSRLRLSTTRLRAGEPLTAEVDLRNVGSRAGDEVAQVYLVPSAAADGGLAPRQQLVAFQRVSLQPGETRHLTFTLDPRQLSLVDSQGVRSVQPGEYRLGVGGDQPQDSDPPTPMQFATLTVTGAASISH